MMRRLHPLPVYALLALMMAAGATELAWSQAVGESQAALERYSVQAAADYTADGYSIREIQTGRLRPGESHYFSTQLAANTQYIFYAAGDETLRGLELKIFDPNWDLVAGDMRQLPEAEANHTTPWSGAFNIQITVTSGPATGAGWFLLTGYK